MPRRARLKVEQNRAWYHVCSRVAGLRKDYPLDDSRCQRFFVDLLEQLSTVYCCRVAGFCFMGNHYHLLVEMEELREVDDKELHRRALRLYPGGKKMLKLWTVAKWQRFAERIFDLSELMRSLQSSFARWYNLTFDRRGRFWGDRFKSTLLENEQAVLDCLLYIELNPVRAGICERPEDHETSSAFLRAVRKDRWLVPLPELTGHDRRSMAYEDYRCRLYYRGAVASKEGQAVIPESVLEEESARGFSEQGMYGRRLRYFADGVAVGSEVFVRQHITLLREQGRYLRRKHPIRQLGGIHLSLREQRC